MARNYISMVQAVANDAGYSGQISSVAGATGDGFRICRFVADACQYIEGLYGDWRFLWGGMFEGVLAYGDRSIAAPVGLYRWDQERMFINDTQIIPELYHNFRPWPGMSVEGVPNQLIIMPDNSLRMYPFANDAYTYSLSYYKDPKFLMADTDEPNIPDKFRKVIEARALWLYAMYDDAAELTAKADAEYATWLALLEADQRPDGYFSNQASGNYINIRVD